MTTDPSNANDVTPQTTPTDLREDHWNDGEIHLRWTQSTDDFDEQRFIRYDVYVNDILSDTPVGSGFSIVYNTNPGSGGLVTVTVIAVDTAGKESQSRRQSHNPLDYEKYRRKNIAGTPLSTVGSAKWSE